MGKIEDLREKIDAIDKEIMSLLNKRYDVSIAVGEEKKAVEKQVLDSNREDIIFDKCSNFSHSPQIKEVYKTIMSESKKIQKR
jgi:monofunctional chorismate mutase